MTERDAKAAVREYLDALGGGEHRCSIRNCVHSKLYDATHAWANSPDGPDALAEFKARVKTSIAELRYRCVDQNYLAKFDETAAPILAECEPPAPPKPKFAAPSWEQLEQLTLDHMTNPQPGDRFHEMYSFWVYVWAIQSDGTIITHEANPPCELPEDAIVKQYKNAAEFAKRFAYGPHMPGKFWVKFCDTSDYHAAL